MKIIKNKKFLICGYSTPGIRTLEYLFSNFVSPENIVLWTHDRKDNTPLMNYADLHMIKKITFKAKSIDAVDYVKQFSPDLLISSYFREIIPESILTIPDYGCMNLHPALLPKHRGCWSGAWAIIEGDKIAGTTWHKITQKVDDGKIIKQIQVNIREEETAFSLYHRLIEAGMGGLEFALQSMLNREEGIEQQGDISYHPRAIPFDGIINLEWDDIFIERYIRAMYFPPLPGPKIRIPDGSLVEIRSYKEYQDIKQNYWKFTSQ